MNIPSDIQPKVKALILRLASDSDAEVVACVRALQRLLSSRGLDLHDLIASLAAPKASPAEEPTEPEAPPMTPSDMADICLGAELGVPGVAWKEHEWKFLRQMHRKDDWKQLSPKQEEWLRGLFKRSCRAEEAA